MSDAGIVCGRGMVGLLLTLLSLLALLLPLRCAAVGSRGDVCVGGRVVVRVMRGVRARVLGGEGRLV